MCWQKVKAKKIEIEYNVLLTKIENNQRWNI